MRVKSDTVLGCIEGQRGYKSGNTAWYNQQVGWVCLQKPGQGMLAAAFSAEPCEKDSQPPLTAVTQEGGAGGYLLFSCLHPYGLVCENKCAVSAMTGVEKPQKEKKKEN